jgi:small subunit ribosomal protein S1
MQVVVTKSAGFCFGVKNAIDKAIKLSEESSDIYTYGPIIHNKKVVEELKAKGVGIIKNIEDIKNGDTIIIRSHGITKKEFDRINAMGAKVVDATCINVKKIHKIVEENSNIGYKIVIIGDPKHPEVVGINGWCDDSAMVIDKIEDIGKLNSFIGKMCIVAQTTFNKEKWNDIVCGLIKKSKEILIYNTICNATELRQEEALTLSKNVDAMIVIGGRESSNTQKLYEICSLNCNNTLFVEDLEELDIQKFKDAKKIGITGGASTPDNVIKGVVVKMSELNKDMNVEVEVEVENEKANHYEDYFADYKDVHPGTIVKGKVIKVSDKEVYVDISYKSDGLLTIDEASYTPVVLKEIYQPGDEIEVKVLQMNDGDGNVVISRKALEKNDFFKKIYAFKEEGTIVDILITGTNKGGLNCQYGDIRGFMPLSLSGISRDEDPETYKGKKLKAKIMDIKEKRGDLELLISRKEIVQEENKIKKAEFFEKIEVDQLYSGVVKALINTGAFVRIGDIDVFIPISEIVWKRIGKPQDVLSEGQRVDLVIIKVDKEHLRATGSIKKTGKEPFEAFITNNNVNDIVKGKVARFADFGVFVELADGVDGLVHISNLSRQRVNKPQDVVNQGDIIDIKIIKIDVEARKISLSLKDALEPEATEVQAETSAAAEVVEAVEPVEVVADADAEAVVETETVEETVNVTTEEVEA